MGKKAEPHGQSPKRSASITLPPSDYQPSRAELREAFDMPGAGPEKIRRAFFRPVEGRRKKPDK
ncbi:MAG: hypothetical protein OXF27_16460 [Acidobacteria bacterium]|nr:hypothetical protein [Acidobacteriota bacterium]